MNKQRKAVHKEQREQEGESVRWNNLSGNAFYYSFAVPVGCCLFYNFGFPSDTDFCLMINPLSFPERVLMDY